MLDESALREMIHCLEAKRIEAMVHADGAVLNDLIHYDVSYGHGSGAIDTKAAYLSKVGDGSIKYLDGTSHIKRVTVLNGAILVFAHVVMDALVGGEARKIDNSILAVWIPVGEGWKMIAHQPTRLS